MTPKELLESLNELDEQTRIEAKLASEVGKSIMETVCAFANEPGLGGGWLLLGVKRDEGALFPSFSAMGVPNPDKLKSDLTTQAREAFNRPINLEFADETVNGVILVSVFVPEADPTDKPIFFQKHSLPGGAFRRVGASDIRCTEEDLFAFYQDRGVESFDSTALRGATLEDFESGAIEEYRSEIRKNNPESEILSWSDEDLLAALNCLKRQEGRAVPTLAGILLFGSQRALRRLLPMTRVDYIRVPGNRWMEGGPEPISSIDMRDSLLRLVRRSVAAIMDDLPEAFSLPAGAIQREVSTPLPGRVIREAIVNALMHRSYRKAGPVQIIRYANRIEIRNPGYSLKPEESLGEAGSITRNPLVAAVLHETRFAETKGSGIRAIRAVMEDTGLTPPIFESDREGDQFTVTLFFHHFLMESDWDWLAAFKDAHLSQDEARALVCVRDNGRISNTAYRDLNRMDTLQASLHLRRLREQGILEQKGKKGPGTFYIGSSAFLATLGQESGALGQESGRNSPDDFPEALVLRIRGLGQRSAPEEMKSVLLEICAVHPYSSEELGELLHRDPQKLVRSYLSSMIVSGELSYLYPDKPNRPDQKYVTMPQGRK